MGFLWVLCGFAVVIEFLVRSDWPFLFDQDPPVLVSGWLSLRPTFGWEQYINHGNDSTLNGVPADSPSVAGSACIYYGIRYFLLNVR